MPVLRDLLDRFRRGLAPPGPALARVAPPVDRRVLVEAELAGTFASLDAAAVAPDERTAAARSAASDAIADAEAAADELLRHTDRRLARLRTEAASERRSAIDEELARIAASSESERARIEAQARDRIPGLVDRVMTRVVEGGA